jgi:hypothetical protein
MSFLTDIIGKVAPTIATALGGPGAGAAVSWLSNKVLGHPDGNADEIAQELQGWKPEQMLALKTMDNEYRMQVLRIDAAQSAGQVSIDLAEAQSGDKFASRWRPFVGWVGGFSLAYATILEPVGRFVAQVGFHYTGAFPVINNELSLQVLIGILGLGGMRSYEKVQSKIS